MANRRVLIDGYYLGKPSGFGRFVFELCRALGTYPNDFEFIVAVQKNMSDEFLIPYKNIKYVKSANAVFPLWEQITIPSIAAIHDCDIIHFPYNTRSFLGRRRSSITTVHDLTFLNSQTERDAKSLLIHAYVSTMFNTSTVRSDAIVSVSETTKQALTKRGVTSERIYNTVDGFISSNTPDLSMTPDRPYFLHRGSYAAGHRNTERIIKAFLSRSELTDRYDLKILGVPDGAKHWRTAANQPVQYLERVTDKDLASLYAGSTCVVAASLLEGFCLPIIEAFGFGSPVIASNINPMMEIAGDAAILVDPLSVEDMARAMLDVAFDDALAADLITKGKRRFLDFSSDKMAAELIGLYQRIAS